MFGWSCVRWAYETLHDVNFALESFDDVDFVFLDDFDSSLRVGAFDNGEVDGAVGALAEDRLGDLVVVVDLPQRVSVEDVRRRVFHGLQAISKIQSTLN